MQDVIEVNTIQLKLIDIEDELYDINVDDFKTTGYDI